MNNLVLDYVKSLNKRIVFLSEHGSFLYKLNGPNSDIDYKGIFIPKYNELIFDPTAKVVKYSTSDFINKNDENDIDLEIYSLKYFCDMALAGQTATFDLLFSNPSNHILIWSEFANLQQNRDKFISKHIVKFLEYAKNQALKYGYKGKKLHVLNEFLKTLLPYVNKSQELDFPIIFSDILEILKLFSTKYDDQLVKLYLDKTMHTSFIEVCGKKYLLNSQILAAYNSIQKIIDQYGKRARMSEDSFIDYKAMSHAFRSAYQVLHIIEDGGFEYPLPETKFIKEVKYGKLQYKDLSDNLEILIDEVYSKLKASSLPDKPDYDWVNNFVYNQYKLYHFVDMYN